MNQVLITTFSHHLSFLTFQCFRYKAQGNFGKAEVFYKKALAMRQKLYGNEHPDVAFSYNNIAMLHKAMGTWQPCLLYTSFFIEKQ